jgi:hypothetical protein
MNIAETLDTTYKSLLERVTNPRQRAFLERLKTACDYLYRGVLRAIRGGSSLGDDGGTGSLSA